MNEPDVAAQGVVTISADRLPKPPEPGTEGSPSSQGRFHGLPLGVWIGLVVVALLVLASR